MEDNIANSTIILLLYFIKMSLDKCRELYHPFLMRLLTKGIIPQLGSAEDGDVDLKLTRHLAVIALVMELLNSKNIF